jgi:primosomal protein N' (replication factor Y)
MAVLLPLPLAKPYTYRLTPEVKAAPGDFVLVPLGRKRAIGVVWGDARERISEARLKNILARLDAPPLPQSIRRFIDWVADYTLTPPGAVLKMSMSVPSALLAPKAKPLWQRGPSPPALNMSEQQRRVLAALASGPASARDLARRAVVGAGVIRRMIAHNLLIPAPPKVGIAAASLQVKPGPQLSPAQMLAARDLATKVRSRSFSATLLEGVTGAGKTEVYFEAIAAALEQGRQALVLLPEIAMTAQWLERFRARFEAAPVLWHSDLGVAQRRQAWRAAASGEARIIVGARSALFLPVNDLGLIVVDEEHDASYKQEEGAIYNARDMAIVRAKFAACPSVLVSATPSLETLVNCQRGRYARLHLPERHGQAGMPEIAAIDMRQTPPGSGRFLSPPLIEALRETFAAGEQALLFLNRRGYAPLTLCGACGHRLACPNCTAWLVEHRQYGRLLCHHCGHYEITPASCPKCGAERSFRACGPGVERLREEIARDFPGLNVAVLASDTLAGPKAVDAVIERIGRRQIDLVIGTQIVAKGHHFPHLTLVGVVDADLGLMGGDLRAAERTHQMLIQVAGRAGRADLPGKVLLQTYAPDHPVIKALIANDSQTFLTEETKARMAAKMPPFGRLAALIVSGADEGEAMEAARHLARLAPQSAGMRVLGPAPAPLYRLRGRYRFRLLAKAGLGAPVQAWLRDWLGKVKLPRHLKLVVDIDPISFL